MEREERVKGRTKSGGDTEKNNEKGIKKKSRKQERRKRHKRE